MRALRINATEKRLLADFHKQDAKRADDVLMQLRAGEISREDFRWLIGEDQLQDLQRHPSRPSAARYRNKFDRWLDAYAA